MEGGRAEALPEGATAGVRGRAEVFEGSGRLNAGTQCRRPAVKERPYARQGGHDGGEERQGGDVPEGDGGE